MTHPLVRKMIEDRMAEHAEAESIKHLDFDPEIGCEVERCEQAARWVNRCRACSVSTLLCDSHVSATRALVALWASIGVKANCTECGAAATSLDEGWELLPLGRAS